MDIYCSTAKLPGARLTLKIILRGNEWELFKTMFSRTPGPHCFYRIDHLSNSPNRPPKALTRQMIILCGIVFLSEALCQLFWIIFQWENCCRCFSASLLPLDHSRVLFVKLYNFKELFSSPSYHFPRVRVCDTSGWRRQGFPSVLL